MPADQDLPGSMCGQCGFASKDLTTPIFPDFHPASAGLVVVGDGLGAECRHRLRAPGSLRWRWHLGV